MKNVSIDEIYTKYINGSNVRELSTEYNVSEKFIYKGLRNYALEKNIDIKAEKKKNKIDMSLIYEMHKSGISCYDIGKLFGCSYRTIFRRLHEYCEQFDLPLDRKTKEQEIIEKMPIIYKEYNNGSSSRELSKKYNCNINMVLTNLKIYSMQEGKELTRKNGRKKTEIPEEKLLEKYINGASLKALAEEYGCSYPTLRARLENYVGKEIWQTYSSHKKGRGKVNKEITLDDMKIVYRRAFAEEIKQIIALKEEKEKEKPKVKSLGRK